MKYICWRSNPQLSDGGYYTVCDKVSNGRVAYGDIYTLYKFKNKDFEKAFPNGVDRHPEDKDAFKKTCLQYGARY